MPQYFGDGRATQPKIRYLYARLGAAADVQANGYSQDHGAPEIGTPIRAGEGILELTMGSDYRTVLEGRCGLRYETMSAFPVYGVHFLGRNGQTVQFSFYRIATGLLADPDAMVLDVCVTVMEMAPV